MKEITSHKELLLLHGRDVIVKYKDKLVEGKISVSSRNFVYFCFIGEPHNYESQCEERFHYNRDRLISHPNEYTHFENKDSQTKHIYLKESEIIKVKATQDTCDEVSQLENRILILKEGLEQDRQEALREAIEKSKISKMSLFVNESRTKLKLRYKNCTLVQINDEGLITYRKSKEALKLFKEWTDQDCKLEACSVMWKGRNYGLGGSNTNPRLFSIEPGEAHYDICGILYIAEGYGAAKCDDENILRMPHNNRAVVHY